MPRIVLEVPQTYENIVRPVALSVGRDIQKILNLPHETTVLFPGQAGVALTANSAVGEKDHQAVSTFGHGARLLMEVSERPVEDRILATAVHQKENLPFFFDEKLKVRMYPIYAGTELTFNLTYRAPNRTLARRFYDEVLTRTAAGREGILHELDYYYLVPHQYIRLIMHIHELRENEDVAPYGQSLEEYAREHFDAKVRDVTDLIGNVGSVAMGEFQTQSQGHFQFVGVTEAEEKEKESGTYNVTFSYTFTFDKVVGAVADYPLTVHQQLLDDIWYSEPRASGQLTDPARRSRAPSHSRWVFDYFSRGLFPNLCRKRCIDGIVVPEFDDWSPAAIIGPTSTLFVGLLGLSKDDPTHLLPLDGDLGGFEIDVDVLEFMRKEAPYMAIKGHSVFNLRLYEGIEPMSDGCVTVDPETLIVRSAFEIDLREVYHLRLSIVHDLKSLTQDAWDRLRSGGVAAVKIVNALQRKVTNQYFSPKLLGGYLISNADMEYIANRVNHAKGIYYGDPEYVMLTVNEVLIEAGRSSENEPNQTQTQSATGDGSGEGAHPLTPAENCDC